MFIPGYKDGSDLTILNVIYKKDPVYDKNGKIKKFEDFLLVVYKDNTKNEKKFHIVRNPTYTYYKAKESVDVQHNMFFIDKKDVDPVKCKYMDLTKSIAENTGKLDYFYDNIRSGNSRANNNLHNIKTIFQSDTNIQDFYRAEFSKHYTNTPIKLNKAYLDIEVDGINAVGDFPTFEDSPINCIAFLNESNNTLYQFLLENDNNRLIKEYKNSMNDPNFLRDVQAFITNTVGGYKRARKYNVDKLNIEFRFYKEEIIMIQEFFELQKKLDPDVLLIYNMAFDLQFFIDRIRYLGYNPEDIICDSRIKEKILNFYVDNRNENTLAERGDYFDISQTTIWLCQMIQFASRRKGKNKYESNKLDYIGNIVARVKKLDYSKITTNIKYLPYRNYRIFSLYSLIDVIAQKCIESCTGDVDYIFLKCLINNTRYDKGHRQSVYLANRIKKSFQEYGYVVGNNMNRGREKPSVKYPGALVGNPLHNSSYSMKKINGTPILVSDNNIDFDYKSLYPSITCENNMAPNTQIGMIEISRKVHNKEHISMYSSGDIKDEIDAKYSRSGEMLDNLMSDNIIEFCYRWLHLANYSQLLQDVSEFYNKNGYRIPLDYNRNSIIHNTYNKPVNLISTIDTSYGTIRNLITYTGKMMNTGNIIDIIKKEGIM